MDVGMIFTLIFCLTVVGGFVALLIDARKTYKEDNA